MENIIEILIKLAGVVLALLLTYLSKEAAKWFKARVSAEDQAKLEAFDSVMCRMFLLTQAMS